MERITRTARTYPIESRRLARAAESAVRELPGWHLSSSSAGELRAVRRTMAWATEVRIVFVDLESGTHTNTLARVEGGRTSGLPLPGRPRRDLKRLLDRLDETLKPL